MGAFKYRQISLLRISLSVVDSGDRCEMEENGKSSFKSWMCAAHHILNKAKPAVWMYKGWKSGDTDAMAGEYKHF